MKTPAEKAEELYDTYTNYVGEYDVNKHAKQCALIAVDEILLGYMGNPKVKYWEQVKQEIEKL